MSDVAPTFHGRDILAPVAARLSCGELIENFGEKIEIWVVLSWPPPMIDGQSIVGHVRSIDPFGNVITDIHRTAVQRPIRRVEAGGAEIGLFVACNGAAPAGSIVSLFASNGDLQLACVGGNAARNLRLAVRDEVRVRY